MPGPLTLAAPGGALLTIEQVPGRGWRCCPQEAAQETCVPLYATLRGALVDCVPDLAEDDPWLRETIARLAPGEA